MGKKRNKVSYFVGDFETTVYPEQDHTEVWLSAVVSFYSDDVVIFKNIDETLKFLSSIGNDIVIYYHNLKFDGSFWICWLETHNFKRGVVEDGDKKKDELENGEYITLISNLGQWYNITIKID